MHLKDIDFASYADVNTLYSYCPLALMCHSRTLNNRINKLHESRLRVVYNDKKSFKHFKNCLTKINLFQYTIEVCKFSQQKCIK